jgi:hypothetical protein
LFLLLWIIIFLLLSWGNFLEKVPPNPFKNFYTGGLGGVCAELRSNSIGASNGSDPISEKIVRDLARSAQRDVGCGFLVGMLYLVFYLLKSFWDGVWGRTFFKKSFPAELI